jgi:hypothetical protein
MALTELNGKPKRRNLEAGQLHSLHIYTKLSKTVFFFSFLFGKGTRLSHPLVERASFPKLSNSCPLEVSDFT